MEAKAWVFERIGQAFSLYVNNFIPLTVAYIVIIFIFEVIVMNLFQFSVLGNLNFGEEGALTQIYTVSTLIWIILGIIWFLAYIMILVPVNIATIKWVQQAYNGTTVTVEKNLRSAVLNILNIFKVYWYIFAYVALIPMCIMIVWLLIILWGQLSGNSILLWLWSGITVIAGIILTVSAIYRGIRTTFSLYNAIEKNEYTKFNFQESIEMSKDNWWRIVWNIMMFAIVVMIGSGLIWAVSGLVWIGWSDIDYMSLVTQENISPEDIKVITESIGKMSISGILWTVLDAILQALIAVFWISFMYIFFKRLQLENDDTPIENISAQKNEARNTDPKKWVIEEL